MNGSIDLTIEDEPTQVYEEYEGYPTTDSETLSSILPLPNNSSTTTSQKNHYKRGRPRESFIWQHFSDDGSMSCSAHTLNLVVTNALKSNLLIQTFILRVKRVINFFSTPKQAENLHNEQINLNYTKVYCVIKDVSTQWNSSFYSWQRLILLKDAIKHLPGRLERIMLSDELTRMMSGNSYVTLSLIYPSITTLKNNLDELLLKERSIDELLIELEGNENTVIEEQDDVFDIVDIPDEDVADDIVYWSVPSSIATLSTILDPRLKSLCFFDSERIEQIKSQLKEEYLIIKDRLDKSELNESQNNFIIENEMDHSEHDLNNVSILKQILQPDNDVVGNYNEISH
ncbi:10175_t:CDS:2 [Entrophospora sp. SA101]|nr:10175_t:CDS:2 [Entrophospora sp. SA101]